MASIGSSIAQDPTTVSSVASATTGKVEVATIAAANVEQTHTFPANTKSFMIKVRTAGKLKWTFDAGTSGTDYSELIRGGFYASPEFNNALLSVYFQSPTVGLEVELVSWS